MRSRGAIFCAFGAAAFAALGAAAESGDTDPALALASKRAEAAVPDVRLIATSIPDARDNAPAALVLVPEGWKIEGQVTWNPSVTTLPEIRISVRDENDGREILLLPRREFVWRFADDPQSPRPLSSAGLEQKPPLGDAVVFLERELVPALHSSSPRIEILEREPLPQIARAAAAGGASTKDHRDVSAARVRTTTNENGASRDEDVYCVLVQSRTPAAGEELIRWGPELVYVLRAKPGELARASGLLETIAASFRIDPAWWNRNAAPAIADRQRRERGLEDATSLRERVSAALAAHYGRTEVYFDPRTEREVRLPSGYQHAWANARGDYLLSSDSARDPRTEDSAGGWGELHAVSAR